MGSSQESRKPFAAHEWGLASLGFQDDIDLLLASIGTRELSSRPAQAFLGNYTGVLSGR